MDPLTIGAIITTAISLGKTIHGLTQEVPTEAPPPTSPGFSAPSPGYGKGSAEVSRLKGLQDLEKYGPRPML